MINLNENDTHLEEEKLIELVYLKANKDMNLKEGMFSGHEQHRQKRILQLTL